MHTITIAGARNSGKTYKAVEQSAKTGAYIVCFDDDEARRLFQEAKAWGFKIPLPISADEFVKGDYHNGVHSIIIDNADLVLRKIAKVPIELITFPTDQRRC